MTIANIIFLMKVIVGISAIMTIIIATTVLR